MLNDTRDSPRTLIAWTIAMVVLAGVLLWTLYQVRGVLLLVYVSGVFAVGCVPLVRVIERVRLTRRGARVSRPMAILVLYLALLGFIALVVSIGLPPLIAQSTDLVRNAPDIWQRVQDAAMRYGLVDHPITLHEMLRSAPQPGDAMSTISSAVSGIVGGVVGLLTILILTFYFLLEADGLAAAWIRLFPPARRAWIGTLSRDIAVKVSAWLRGQLLLALIIGVSAGIGLWVIGVPYALVLALIAAVGELIPVVGPLIAAVPAIAVAFSVSPSTAVITAVFFFVQQQLENNVLVPKIMEKQVGVSAITVMIALMIGASLLGIVGALLAIPTAAVVQVLVQDLLQHPEDADDAAG